MKKIILIIIIFTGVYSETIIDFSDKTMKNKYLKKSDFKYFEYNLSDCKMSDRSKTYSLKSNGYILEFNLNENNQPDGIWRRERTSDNDRYVTSEECYNDGKLIKKYEFIYFPLSKENKLIDGTIYYPKKDFTYNIEYINSEIKHIYFEVGDLDYFFSLNSKKKLRIIVASGVLLKHFDYKEMSLYDFYIDDINKLLELEISN